MLLSQGTHRASQHAGKSIIVIHDRMLLSKWPSKGLLWILYPGRQQSMMGGQQKPGWKLTAGSCAEEKERPEGVNAKGRWGEHEAGKDDAALPLESLQ